MLQNEAHARIKINQLLKEAGWRFFQNNEGKANILLENHVKITQKEIDAWGSDYDKIKSGSLDFLLVDSNNKPICVLEAKKESLHPLVAKEQARKYANTVGAQFIILSNGIVHYLWDLKKGNPKPIYKFPSPSEIGAIKEWNPDRNSLATETVANDYIVTVQMPDYFQRPGWNGSIETSKDFIWTNGLRFLRPYQLNAVLQLQKAVREGKDRFLFEMATGTGKTLTSAAVIRLFLRTKNARTVLFLVDRLELEDQAWKAFTNYLKPDYTTFIFKEQRSDWRKADILVTTIQSLMFDNKYRSEFSPTDFDLIISDESHRSISGNARAVFEYFHGYKLGLTATPKDYLKGVEETADLLSAREWAGAGRRGRARHHERTAGDRLTTQEEKDMEDILMQYFLKILGYILSAAAVWLGYELKKLAKKYVNTQTKKDVARTVVQAVEQMYKDLHGDEKLNKAMERASVMLEEQGVHVTTLELRTLIEDAVGEFNGVFWNSVEEGTAEKATE